MEIFVNILFYIFVFSIVIQLFYAFYFFKKLSTFKKNESQFQKGVSVIICAKNEEKNLEKNLSSFLKQNYPFYEVIVVNDQSVDRTKYVLQDFEKHNFNLKVVTIEENVMHLPGKKFALTMGLKAAKYDYVLLSDADCMANSENWLKQMVSSFSEKDIILGFGAYKKKKGLLNKFIRFDTFQVALQYFSYSLSGIPYMGVGRNLAYKKSLFFENKGFASHLHVPSGDDDLFIQEVATKDNVTIQITENSHTTSEVMESWGEWIYQKRRHITTSKYYKQKHKILLAIWSFSQMLFWILSIPLFILFPNIYIFLSLFLFRIAVYYFVYNKSMKQLEVKDLYPYFPLIEFFYLLVQGFFVLLNLFYKPKLWK